jgi:hypothetical protein
VKITPDHRRDPLAPWFAQMRALGDLPDILIGRQIDVDTPVVWTSLPHEYFDGMGALAMLLRRSGYDVGVLPAARSDFDPADATLAQRLKRFLAAHSRGMEHVLDAEPPWRDFDPAIAPAPVTPETTWLSVEQTDRLRASAEAQGASLNSLLLAALDRAIDPLLIDPWAPRHWMVPVNMRGQVRPTCGRDTANHSCAVMIRTKAGYSPLHVHEAIRHELKRGMHLAAWTKLRTVTMFGGHVVGRLQRLMLKHPQYVTGELSNLGDWSPRRTESTKPVDGERWYFAATPGRYAPLFAGALVWHGRACLTFGVHSGIAQSHQRAADTMARWREALLTFDSSPPAV